MKIYKLEGSDDACAESEDSLTGCTFIVYEYTEGSYEGQGQALIRYKKKWVLEDLSHCSCYGPWEDIDFTKTYKNLNTLIKKITGTWLDETIKLIDVAREHEDEWDKE